MLPDLLGLLIVAAVIFAAARVRRPARPADAPGPEPPRAERARSRAVPVQPSSAAAEPFAYDDGVITGPPEGGRS